MKRLVFIYNNLIFLDFIKSYLSFKDFDVICAHNGLEGIRLGIKENPDLMIVDKNVIGIDLEGFLIKKRINPVLQDIPVFLLGDFSPKEIQKYGQQNVKAFISFPINPHALLERLNLFFKIHISIQNYNRTPMLVDMHNKGNIIIIQIEGNFEPDKLEILNYEIRNFCHQKKLTTPRVFIIIPSIYPESITMDNINLLFKFMTYPEFNLSNYHVKLLTQCNDFLKVFKSIKIYQDIENVANFIEGIQKLNLDIDNKKNISIDHLKDGASYIFDLYDDTGMVRIPALTKVTQNMLDYLKKSGEKRLTYYSETSLEESNEKEVVYSKNSKESIEKMITDYDIMNTEEFDVVKTLKDDKMKLFFSKLKNQKVLIVSLKDEYNKAILEALKPYVELIIIKDGNIIPDVEKERFISIFLDIDLENPSCLELLKMIRDKVSRRSTSVIITGKNINRETFNLLKSYGTDNILIEPFNSRKVLRKVFESVSSDRKK